MVYIFISRQPIQENQCNVAALALSKIRNNSYVFLWREVQ